MPSSLQVKLLSVLDDGAFFPVGSERRVKVNVRIIAATHRSLAQQVQDGHFREDLYFRINVLQLHLPPLRERDADLTFLLHHYLQQTAKRNQRPGAVFSPAALDCLQRYHYPGNIRELRNIIEYGVCVSQTGTIDTIDLPVYLRNALAGAPTDEPAAGRMAGKTQSGDGQARQDREKNWQEVEKEMILDAMVKCRGNRSQAAELLGWGRTTLWRKLKHHGLVGVQDAGGSAV